VIKEGPPVVDISVLLRRERARGSRERKFREDLAKKKLREEVAKEKRLEAVMIR
jgi:hypothetical protein